MTHGTFRSLCDSGSNIDLFYVEEKGCPNLIHLSPLIPNTHYECVSLTIPPTLQNTRYEYAAC
jgi:hypothetical protein